GAIPGAGHPTGGGALLDLPRVPEQDQGVDETGQWGRAGHRALVLLLGLGEAQELLLVVKGDLQGPAASIPGQDEGRVHREIGAEERIVVALAGRVADAQALLERAIQQIDVIGNAVYRVACLLALGEAHLLAGRRDRAHALISEGLALSEAQ